MNWNFIGHKTGEIFLESFIIIATYFLSKELISYRKSVNKATSFEKFWIISKRIIVSIIAAYLLDLIKSSYDAVGREKISEWVFIFFFTILVPALFGVINGLEIDAKLTEEQRKVRRELNKWKSKQPDGDDY